MFSKMEVKHRVTTDVYHGIHRKLDRIERDTSGKATDCTCSIKFDYSLFTNMYLLNAKQRRRREEHLSVLLDKLRTNLLGLTNIHFSARLNGKCRTDCYYQLNRTETHILSPDDILLKLIFYKKSMIAPIKPPRTILRPDTLTSNELW